MADKRYRIEECPGDDMPMATGQWKWLIDAVREEAPITGTLSQAGRPLCLVTEFKDKRTYESARGALYSHFNGKTPWKIHVRMYRKTANGPILARITKEPRVGGNGVGEPISA